MNFSHIKFRSVCAALGIKQKHLVHGLGVSKGTASNWITGKRKPKDEEIPRIAALIGVPVGELLDDREVEKMMLQESPSGVNITNQLTPKARTILKMIAELEGVDENEAMSRAIQSYGSALLQGSAPTSPADSTRESSQPFDKENNQPEK